MYKYFGDREIALCRELTKLHEEISRTTLSAAIAKYTETPPKGEFVIVIRGYKGEDEAAAQKPDPLQMVKQLMAEGKSLKDAVKETSKALSYPKNHLYDAALEMMSKEEQQ
jgi:16S rRNA (cytidine1402-2'-O)-methyltransferase